MTDKNQTTFATEEQGEPGDLQDQLLQLGLREVLGSETPPDLSDQILQRFTADPTPSTKLAWFRSKRARFALRCGTLLAIAAGLLLMCGVAERGLYRWARRSANIKNSKQIGLAALNHESALSRFPTASDYTWDLATEPQGTRTEQYTVNVPVQTQRTQSYTVNVPATENNRYRYYAETHDEPALIYPSSKFWDEISVRRDKNGYFAAIDSSNSMIDATGNEVDRKIRYNANVGVIVDQFDEVADKVAALVKRHEGFIASTNLGQMRGEQRSGNWVVRIPTANYEAFIGSIDEVGILDSRSENAQDLTAQYVDLESRIANKQKLEERIVKLLERPDDKLKDVIEVERELARVRQEVEQMQGQLRVMADQTSLATVTINVREERDYVPTTAPTVSSRLANAWSNGFSRSGNFFMNLTIWFIEMLIPIIACIVGAALLLRFVRRWWAKRAKAM